MARAVLIIEAMVKDRQMLPGLSIGVLALTSTASDAVSSADPRTPRDRPIPRLSLLGQPSVSKPVRASAKRRWSVPSTIAWRATW